MESPAIRTARPVGASLLAATLVLTSAVQAGQVGPLTLDVAHKARALQPGEVVLVEASSPAPLQSLDVLVFERTVPMWSDAKGRDWKALVGIDVEVAGGRYDLRLVGFAQDGREATGVDPIDVVPKAFAERHLRVNPRFSEPPPSVQPRIAAEAARLEAIFGTLFSNARAQDAA